VLTFSALLPNILGFLAFEYGKEIIEKAVSKDQTQPPDLEGLRRL